MKINKQTIIELTIIAVLSLTPLLWYDHSNSIALGHDMGFPFSPYEHFVDRLFAWTERNGVGANQELSLAGFFLHGFEGLLDYLGFSIFLTQKITFVFWFAAPIFSAYILFKFLFKEKGDWFLRLFATVFYGINHFNIQAWSIAERTKFSTATALPLTLFLVLRYQNKQATLLKTSLYFGLVFFIFNGGGSPPLFGSIILAHLVLITYFFVSNAKQDGYLKSLISQTKLVVSLIIFTILINAYWLFPLGNTYLNSYSAKLGEVGGIKGVIDWVNVISANANIANIIRLHGIPDWYDNPNHPFANLFVNNIFAQTLAFAFPILAFSSLLLAKGKKQRQYTNYFALTAIVALAFASGTAGPLNGFYNYLVSNLPGFSVFRSPIYKFGGLLWLSYGALIAFTLNSALKLIKTAYPKLNRIFGPILIFAYLLYNYPIITGSFFNFLPKPYSTMVQLPPYILNAGEELNKLSGGGILVLPPLEGQMKVDRYEWGYWSTTTIPSTLVRKKTIENDITTSAHELKIINNTYESLYNKNWARFGQLASSLDIQYLLLKKDYLEPDTNPVSISQLSEDLKQTNNFSLLSQHGEWEIFKINNYRPFNNLVYEDISYINTISPEFRGAEPILNNYVYLDQESAEVESALLVNIDVTVLLECEGCDRQFYFYDNRSDPDIFWYGSQLYKLTKIKEESMLHNARNQYEQILLETILSFKRLREVHYLLAVNRATIPNIEPILKEQKRKLLEIERLIGTLDSNQYSREDVQAINKTLITLRHQKELAYGMLGDFGDKGHTFLILLENIAIGDRIASKLDPLSWLTDQDESLKYLAKTPIDGEYEVYLNKNEFLEFFDNYEDFQFAIDGNQLDQEITEQNGLIRFGPYYLTEGLHKISLDEVRDRNILNLADFTVTSTSTSEVCNSYLIQSYDGLNPYKLQFASENISGNPGRVYLVILSQTNEGSRVYTNRLLPKDLSEVSIDIDPFGREANLEINFCSTPNGSVPSTNEISNLKLTKETYPGMILHKTKANTSNVSSAANISLNRDNPTKYTGYLNNPDGLENYIAIPESFDKQWELTLSQCLDSQCSSTKPPETNSAHYYYTGFANAWRTNKKGEYKVNIHYKPQKVYLTGWATSILSIIILGSMSLIWKEK